MNQKDLRAGGPVSPLCPVTAEYHRTFEKGRQEAIDPLARQAGRTLSALSGFLCHEGVGVRAGVGRGGMGGAQDPSIHSWFRNRSSLAQTLKIHP